MKNNKFTIVVYRDKKLLYRIPVKKKLISIGRSGDMDIVLEDKLVSSMHANIIFRDDKITIMDMDSTNGLMVNNTKIKKTILKPEDNILVGSFMLKIEVEVSEPQKEIVGISSEEAAEGEQTISAEKYYQQFAQQTKKIKENVASLVSGEVREKLIDTISGAEEIVQRAVLAESRLNALYQVGLSLHKLEDTNVTLSLILDEALRLTPAEFGCILLANDDGKMAIKLFRSIPVLQNIENVPHVSNKIIEDIKINMKTILVENREHDDIYRESQTMIGGKIISAIASPLKNSEGQLLGMLYLDSCNRMNFLSENDRVVVEGFSVHASLAIENSRILCKREALAAKSAEEKTEERFREQLKKLEKERTGDAGRFRMGNLLGKSKPMAHVFEQIRKVATADVVLLIMGDTGTGKGVVAKTIHEQSKRNKGPFQTIDCTAIPSELMESELFGHERGSFTGAVAQKKGRIELAEKGTLFLEEIGELSVKLQAKLLRFLQEKRFERVGGQKSLFIDTRVICATNRDLEADVKSGKFREDLFYRINVVPFKLPSLRERDEDILLLSDYFLKEYCKEAQKPIKGFTKEAIYL
ncbi:MAG: sigma 54-interacting transcriptional regulator, partial [bacterium]